MSIFPEGVATMRLLIVEDYKPLLLALKRGLEEEGFTVVTALDGDEANNQARSANFDLIVLDLTLPKQDGLKLLQQWRDVGLKCPVLILLGRDRPDAKVRRLNLGPVDCLTKPFRFDDLLARIRVLAHRNEHPDHHLLRIPDMERDTPRLGTRPKRKHSRGNVPRQAGGAMPSD
jgi:DNA-binding response OmpR family regulator